jgi:hypothetical protein
VNYILTPTYYETQRIADFWGVMLCSLVDKGQHFRGTHCPRLQNKYEYLRRQKFTTMRKLSVMYKSHYTKFFPRPIASTLLGPNAALSTLFSGILNQCSSLNVTDQLSRPYKATVTYNFVVLCTLTFRFREIRWGGMDWIDLAQDTEQWRALVNTVMNRRVP